MSPDCLPTPDECGCSLELVWDGGLNATAVARPDGAAIRVGPAANLSPEHLIALAASSCLMTSLLTAAGDAGVPVRGYVSSARFNAVPGAALIVALAPCVVVDSEIDRSRIEALWPEAIQRSPTLRLLEPHLQVEPTVKVAPAPQG